MIETIKIESIEIKNGVSKSGRGYAMPVIETADGRKISMYIDKEYDTKIKNLDKIQEWEVGDVVNVSIEQNGDYLNFKLPSKTDLLDERITVVAERVSEVEEKVEKIETTIKNAQKKKE